MFVAAIVVGGFGYALQRLTAKALRKLYPVPTPSVVRAVRLAGWVLFFVETAAGCLFAWAVYHHAATWADAALDDPGTLLLILFIFAAGAALWYVKVRRA